MVMGDVSGGGSFNKKNTNFKFKVSICGLTASGKSLYFQRKYDVINNLVFYIFKLLHIQVIHRI